EFAIPAILGMLVNGAYNVIDSIFLGQAMGEIGLSAATVAMPIMAVFMALAMLIGTGGNALAALRMGEGRRLDAEVSLGNTVFLGIVVAIVIALC
ncbi:MAG: MATE family efflux transporter, partial [Raoultibacter sp.]